MVKNPAYTLYGKTATQLYRKYNRKYFDGKLPKLPILWPSKLRKTSLAGYTEYNLKTRKPTHIALNPRFCGLRAIWILTLLHEMCHVKTGDLGPDEHGPRWQREMHRLARKGAFDNWW